MFKRHNSRTSVALEYALLFLAIAVFSWGLRGKLALYHTESGSSSMISTTAKLTTEERSARSVVAAHTHIKPRFTPDSMCRVTFAFTVQIHDAPVPNCLEAEPGPATAGLYNLHGPDFMLRPPPALS